MGEAQKQTHGKLHKRTSLEGSSHRFEQFYKNANRRTHGWSSVFVRAWLRFNHNHATESAASITFFSIFSIIPLIVFISLSVGSFIASPIVQQSIRNYLANAFPVSLEGLMDVVMPLLESRGSVNLIATLSFLWAASNMFYFLLLNIHRAWDNRSSRGIVKNRLLALAFVTAMAVVLVALLILSFLIRLVAGLIPQLGNRLLTQGLPLLIQMLLIFSLYKFGPATATGTKPILIGAFLTTLAMEITTRGFTWYLNSGWSTYNTFYGSLGALIGLLFWVYLSYWILLFGAYLSEALFVRWNSDNPNEFLEPLVVNVSRSGP